MAGLISNKKDEMYCGKDRKEESVLVSVLIPTKARMANTHMTKMSLMAKVIFHPCIHLQKESNKQQFVD